MKPKPARTQLAEFMAKYTPQVAAEGRAALATVRRLVPGATELVYDNWNFLVVGFGLPIRPTAKRSLVIRSISARQRPRRPKEE